jgi:hypothetical protein
MRGRNTQICICGGGSLGHVCAGVLSSLPGVSVSILSGHPEKWGDSLEVTDPDGKVYSGKLKTVSSDPAKALEGSDIVLLCVPGYLIEKTLRTIKPFIGEAAVGSVVCSTGFFFFAHEILGPKAKLFGFQRVPYIARVAEYGSKALLLGYKSELIVALENLPAEFTKTLQDLFGTPVVLADNYLQVSLTNSNPILHTGRLYSMFRGREDELFDHNILFYKEWTDEASQTLIEMDKEFFGLLDKLGVKGIPTLLDYYESTDAASLTRKISSIAAFQNITSPMIPCEGGWKLDRASRYFTEDFPFGLRWIKELAEKNNLKTPVIDKVYGWGMKLI